MTEMIAMPAVMTEEMRNHWRSAFLSGLHNRRGRGVVGDARKAKHPSAEEAAWKSLVKKYGVPLEDDGADAISSGKLGALFLGKARAQAVVDRFRDGTRPEAWVIGEDDQGPMVAIYEDRPEDLKERRRLEDEMVELKNERVMLVNTVVFNEVTYDAKIARMEEIDRLVWDHSQAIDRLDCPPL